MVVIYAARYIKSLFLFGRVYYFGFAVLKVMPTDVDGGGEVYFVVMLGVFTRDCDQNHF